MHEAFKTHLLNEKGITEARAMAQAFDVLLEDLKAMGVEGRYLAIVTTKLEEAAFFAKKGIAVNPTNQKEA